MPAYSEEALISNSIMQTLSIVEQFAPDMEIIAVNDGSKDKTKQEIERAIRDDAKQPHPVVPGMRVSGTRIKLVTSNKNRGNDAVRDGIMEIIAKDPHVDLTRMRFHRIQKFEPFRIGHLKFTPLKAYHKLDEEALIFVIEDGRSTLLYANDTGALPEETLDFIEQQNIKFDVVSMDTSRGILDGDTHMGIRENVELREKLRRMHAVTPDTEYYLNHYSHMCGMIPQEYERLVGQEGFLLTYDGLSVTV